MKKSELKKMLDKNNFKNLTWTKAKMFILLFTSCGPLLMAARENPRTLSGKYAKQFAPEISFMENRGQVTDQHHQPRPDVLFSGSSRGMVYHLRSSGISYQLSRAKSSAYEIYRLDVNWLNINREIKIATDEMVPGCDHFYRGEHPVLNVKTYAGVTYKNIYTNIDLHYYEKGGDLKYDYIVAPHADYKQIQLEVNGAEKMILQANGSIVFKTPLGDILEGAPLVYQGGRKINAAWKITDNVLGFDISGYDPSLPLLIDPATRVWGTYYGGGPSGLAGTVSNGCTTDANGNVYLTGSTDGGVGTGIATSGAHQTTVAGFLSAYLAKFNNAGVRQWGTYYGGPGTIVSTNGNACRVDAGGNVYMVGQTSANANIVTTGCHQAIMGGAADGFIVKFNSAGVRQWGTYYGGTGLDVVQSCAIDASGNLYITGRAASPTDIATPGTHQPVFGGGTADGFLAKFNSAGVRQWGTYYGDAGTDVSYGCALDAGGNIYICGQTQSSSGISTPGSHQVTFGGGTADDGFLAKFNSAGVRQWGSYYGGTGADFARGCSVDASGNMYITGSAASNAGIATPGSHQSTFGGGPNDAFVAKFNTAGVRQWGTYYGGSGDDNGSDCIADPFGNIVVVGETVSTANIATMGSHQTTYGGGTLDAFLIKLTGTGLLQWGTYYGGGARDDGSGCTLDNAGTKIYIAGSTASAGGTVIATAGGHQSSYLGPNDGFLVQFSDCNAPNAPVNTTAATNLTLCSNNTTTLSATASGPVSWFSSGSSTVVLSTGGSFSTPMLTSGLHTYYAETTNTCSPSARTPITVTVNPLLTVNSGSICAGGSFTIVPGGANTYTFSGGSAVVNPLVTTFYTVTGIDQAGCTGTVVSTVTVNTLPVITVNSGTVCAGNAFTLQPNGANTYTFSGGSAVVSPTTNTSYTVTGTSNEGCVSAGVISNVTVNAVPVVTVATSKATICKGESAKLTTGGAASYSWSNGSTGTLVTVNPTTTTSYTVTGTGANGCFSKMVITQSVNACAGLSQNPSLVHELSIVPNPGNGYFNIVTSLTPENGIVEVYNSLGEIIVSEKIGTDGNRINLTQHANGVYFVRVLENNRVLGCLKILKE